MGQMNVKKIIWVFWPGEGLVSWLFFTVFTLFFTAGMKFNPTAPWYIQKFSAFGVLQVGAFLVAATTIIVFVIGLLFLSYTKIDNWLKSEQCNE